MSLINPFVEDGHKLLMFIENGKVVTCDFQWHLDNPKLTPIPGQDYNVPPGGPVRSPATGFCAWSQMDDGLFLVSIQYGADAVTIRELGSVTAAAKSHQVTQGEVIGYAAGAGQRSPHWEYDHGTGGYSPAENYVTSAPVTETTNGVTMDGTLYQATDGGISGTFWLLSASAIHLVYVPGDTDGSKTLGVATVLAARTNRAIAYATAEDYPAWNGATKNGVPISESSANLTLDVQAIGAPAGILGIMATGNLVNQAGARLDTWFAAQQYVTNTAGQLVLTPPGTLTAAQIAAIAAQIKPADLTPVLTAITNLPTMPEITTLAQQAVGAVATDITATETAIVSKIPVGTFPSTDQIATATVALFGEKTSA